MLGDRFQVVITTHLNTNHIHNHFGCNSFEKEGNISDFESALNFLSNDSIISKDLISKIYDISDFYEAIEYIKDRKMNECIKVMIKM